MDYRKSQEDILDQNPDLAVGDVTTVNLTILQVTKNVYLFYFAYVRGHKNLKSFLKISFHWKFYS